MTWLQRYTRMHPDEDETDIVLRKCPAYEFSDFNDQNDGCPETLCRTCWNMEILGTVSDYIEMGVEDSIKNPDPKIVELVKEATTKILDSGNRREFETGAVRDIQVGKGRCDLLPLDIVAMTMASRHAESILQSIWLFQEEGEWGRLKGALWEFAETYWPASNPSDNTMGARTAHMLLEVSKHFEEGCDKYGEDNWKKGIPVKCYIDSAVRHFLKFLRGDKDEPHDRAFCWNILCAMWTCKNMPELNSYAKAEC